MLLLWFCFYERHSKTAPFWPPAAPTAQPGEILPRDSFLARNQHTQEIFSAESEPTVEQFWSKYRIIQGHQTASFGKYLFGGT